jgi:hypothetical protein
MRKQQHSRNQYCAKRVDVLKRIESNPTQQIGGIVPEQFGHEPMRRLMESDCNEQRYCPDGNQDDYLIKVHFIRVDGLIAVRRQRLTDIRW